MREGMWQKMEIRPILLDERTKNDLIRQMEELAKAYTPEWKFHSLFPDSGSVLMHIYADMLMDTIHRYNRLLERDKMQFFQYIGTEQRSGEPARGYVSLGMASTDLGDAEVPIGTGILGTTDEDEQVRLETQKDILVSTGEIQSVFYIEGTADRICCLAEQEGVLAVSNLQNLQEHICWIGHTTVFSDLGEADIHILLLYRGYRKDWKEIVSDREKTSFSYISVDGEREFSDWRLEGNILTLHKSEEMPEFQSVWQGGETSCFLKWQAKDIQAYTGLEFQEILLASTGRERKPEFIYTADGQEANSRCYPFGERPYLFGECFLCSNEVFGKKGAVIKLSLSMEFRKTDLLIEPVPQPIQWKTVMKESDFPKEEVRAVTVGEVAWEYYNGVGFTRLFSEPLYIDGFRPEQEEGQEKILNITFTCPEDISPILVNAQTIYCIRIRIVKMYNEFTRYGYYLTPFLNRVELSYDYQPVMKNPEIMGFYNNLEEQWRKNGKAFTPFQSLREMRPAVYIGFNQPLEGGPFGLYCGIPRREVPAVGDKWNYEFFNGREWRSLVLEDETENLTKNGVIMPFGNQGFQQKQLFGKKLYWIRFVRLSGASEERTASMIPVRELWFNTVPVLAAETVPEEFFTMRSQDTDAFFQLKHEGIVQISVWVNETGLSSKELEKIEDENEVDYIQTEGHQREIWVLWTEVKDFGKTEPDDRHYRLDRREGKLFFPKAGQGRIPRPNLEKGIRVQYTWGGGSQGNLKAGQVTHLDRSIRFLNQITNRFSLTGGRDAELPEEAVKRTSARLLHRERAVMLSDYEALAKEAAREVAKVKAYANRNGAGELQRGAVTLVVLQENYQEGSTDFQSLQQQLRDYILERMPGISHLQKHLYIVPPWFTEIQVSAVCLLKGRESVFQCRAEAEEKLIRFLNPLTGNSDGRGWEIGTAPNREQIRNVLRDVHGIESIQTLMIKAYCHNSRGLQEIDLEGKIPDYQMIISGVHKIQFELDSNDIH